MLIQFSFKNYKSFKEEAVLDLSASKMTEFSDRVVTIGGEKILPVAAIYGANASGKSNVYSAFEYMSEYVVQSFKYGDEKEDFRATRPAPFLFADDTENAETSFEVYFTIPDDKTERIYNYGFCIDGSGITEEWLNSRAKSAREMSPVFYRDKETLDLSGLPKNSHSNIEVALEKQVLISSLGAKLKVAKCKQVRDWFLCNEFADFGDPVTSLFLHRRLPDGFVDDPAVRAKVVKYFSSFDETIKDFRVEKVPTDDDKERERYRITAIHKKIDSDKTAEIPLGEESAGTLKMQGINPSVYDLRLFTSKQGIPVVVLLPPGENLEKTMSNLEEVRARGADVLAIGARKDKEQFTHAKDIFLINDEVDEIIAPLVYIVPLQLLSYYVAISKEGVDPDKPKNLAKCVTVE